ERAPRTAVQPAAIVERDGASVLFVVRDGRASRVAVKKGAAIGELLEVGGVNAGDPVVLRPPERLRDGMAVAVTAK
ncbi:MAG: efflux RND transporter periplasmic adaptor subunit, partial [Burkholderiales bacterium]|nr:efflux RND transporter periplasmic adaptor subunit [Burkholderiales bacterium]